MQWVSLLSYGLAAIAGTFILSVSGQTAQQSGEGLPNEQTITPDATETTSPHRLTITVSIADPDDLKVEEGQDVTIGDLIADRSRERSRLEAQRQQLELSLTQLKTARITPPLPPVTVPAIAPLPPTSYLEQQAAIDRSKVDVDQSERAIALKQQEIAYLQQLEHLNPLILDHEQAQLDELQHQHDAAVRDYQLAVGRFNTAQDTRAYQDYQRSIAVAQRVEQANQAALNYQQQRLTYEQRLRDRAFQVSQTQLKLDEVNNAIANLATVRAPYSGRVRRVQWLAQNPDGSLSVEITLLVNPSDRPNHGTDSPLPEQQPGLPQPTDGSRDRPQS